MICNLSWKILDILQDEVTPNSGIKILSIKCKGSHMAAALDPKFPERNIFQAYFGIVISVMDLGYFPIV